MSWFSDIKNDSNRKKLYFDYAKTCTSECNMPEHLSRQVLGDIKSMPLIEYVWRHHVYPLTILGPSYDMSVYRALELVASSSKCLVTPPMYEAALMMDSGDRPEPLSTVTSSLFNWGYSKEIYRFNPDIVAAIKDSDCREYDPSIFEKLPFDCFYIDCKVGQWDGVLVTNYPNSFQNKFITMVLISSDFPNDKGDWFEKSIGYDKAYSIDYSLGYEDDIKAYLNLINFMSCKNAEITGTEHRYVTDKKTNTRLVRQDSREYRVNIVFENEQDKKIVYHYLDDGISGAGSRSPHIRKAHWGKYWVYKRDAMGEIDRSSEKEPIFHWIPPTFINGRVLQDTTIRIF